MKLRTSPASLTPKLLAIAPVIALLSLSGAANGQLSTTANYWQFDSAGDQSPSVGSATLTRTGSQFTASAVPAANPVPNPDTFSNAAANPGSILSTGGQAGSLSSSNAALQATLGTASTNWTIEGWFQLEANATFRYLAGTRDVGTGFFFDTRSASGNAKVNMFFQDNSNRTVSAQSAANLNFGTDAQDGNLWYHYAFVWNTSTKSLNLYLNGFLDSTVSVAATNASFNFAGMDANDPGFFYVGGRPGGNNTWSGRLDEMRISSTNLAPSSFLNANTWFSNSGGNWSDTNKWSAGNVVDGVGATANLISQITADRTVTVDSNRTVGRLMLSDPNGTQVWTVASSGGSTLTLAAAGTPEIQAATAAVISAQLAGTQGFTKTGAGDLTLSGSLSNSLTGTVSVNAGRLLLNKTGATALNGDVSIASGGTLRWLADNQIADTASVTVNSGGSFELNGRQETLGSLTFNSGATAFFTGAGGNLQVTSNLTLGSVGTVNSGSVMSGNTLTVAGGDVVVGGAGASGRLESGSGGFVFSSGSITLNNGDAGGEFRVGGNATINSTNTLVISNNGAPGAVKGFVNLGSSDRTFMVNHVSGSHTTDLRISTAVTGTGGLVKDGAGLMELSGDAANTYSGTTTVTAGTLQLNKATGVTAINGNVSVGAGAVLLLSASDQVSDTSEVTLSGGTLQRGGGVNEGMGDLTLTSGSTLDYGTGAAGTLTFGTYAPSLTTKLVLSNFGLDNKLRFVGSDLTGFIDASFTGSSFDNGYFAISGMAGFTSSWDSGVFTITSVPEPSTIAAALGLLGIMGWPAVRRFVRTPRV